MWTTDVDTITDKDGCAVGHNSWQCYHWHDVDNQCQGHVYVYVRPMSLLTRMDVDNITC
jgi:hypothetical protein